MYLSLSGLWTYTTSWDMTKFATNKNRDAMVADKLNSLGWQVLIIWECQTTKDIELDALAWAILAASPDK